jgi:hypothetical protein
MKKLQWKWSDDCKCYYIAEFNNPPKVYCLGDRYVYAHFGIDSYGIMYRGSTLNNWGGFDFGYNLKLAIEWVQSAEQPELNFSRWDLAGMKPV